MTFDERDLNRALAGMRDAVRRQAGPAPAAAALRRRAERKRRIRQAAMDPFLSSWGYAVVRLSRFGGGELEPPPSRYGAG